MVMMWYVFVIQMFIFNTDIASISNQITQSKECISNSQKRRIEMDFSKQIANLLRCNIHDQAKMNTWNWNIEKKNFFSSEQKCQQVDKPKWGVFHI